MNERTDRDWRTVSYAVQAVSYVIGNVLQCWEHQGQLETILAYQQYADEVTSEVVEMLADLQTTSFPRSEASSNDIWAGIEPTTEIHWRGREGVRQGEKE